jgi:hypothetical protein
MPKKKTKTAPAAPPKKRIRPPPPKLTLETFIKELHTTARYRSWRGARRAVGRAEDWTPEEREIGFKEIDRRWPDAPPRVHREFLDPRGARARTQPSPAAAGPRTAATLSHHLGQAVSTGDLAYLMWVVEQLGKQVDHLARAAETDPTVQPELEVARRQWRAAATVAFGKIDLPSAAKPSK